MWVLLLLHHHHHLLLLLFIFYQLLHSALHLVSTTSPEPSFFFLSSSLPLLLLSSLTLSCNYNYNYDNASSTRLQHQHPPPQPQFLRRHDPDHAISCQLNSNSSSSNSANPPIVARQSAYLADSVESVSISTYTAPEPSPASIDNDEDVQASVEAVSNDPEFNPDGYDAVLVACFSVHPLVKQLAHSLKPIPVIGIFEASILTSLSLVPLVEQEQQQWGIVTTGAFWESHLSNGVAAFLGQTPAAASPSSSPSISDDRFAGVFSTGLNAGDFHTISQQQINVRLREATKRLLSSGNVTCVVMGCGGMGGLQDMIRDIIVQEYGQDRAKDVSIVDGVQAGVLQLQQTVLSRRVFGVK